MTMFALILTCIEGARTAGSSYYYQVALNASLDTLFSQYHKELWERYRIFGLQYSSDDDLISRTGSYVDKYLGTKNWYPINNSGYKLRNVEKLTDKGGDLFAGEAVEYMRFAELGNLIFSPGEEDKLVKDVKEAVSAGETTDTLNVQDKEVKKLETAAEKLLNCIKEQELRAENIRHALDEDDPDAFHSEANEFRKEAGKMDSLVVTYEKRSDEFNAALEKHMVQLAGKKEDFQENRDELFEEQLNVYEIYARDEEKRRSEFLMQKEVTSRNLVLLSQTEDLVERLVNEWKNQDKEHEVVNEEGETVTETVEEPLSLSMASGMWSSFEYSSISYEKGEGDSEKRGFLESVKSLAEDGLISFIMPPGTKISDGTISSAGLPSNKFQGNSASSSVISQILLNEYCSNFFTNALSDEKKDLQYELEYILKGNESDSRNLEQTVSELFLVREGLNMMHILSSSSKREEAKSLAFAITGITGLAPVVEITAVFIMAVWAAGESLADLKELFKGGKIPLFKSDSDWQLSLDGLLSLGMDKVLPDSSSGQNEEKGLGYEDYLSLLLLAESREMKQLRMLDVIQTDIARDEPGFLIEKCAYHIEIEGRAQSKHVFFTLPFAADIAKPGSGYDLTARSEKKY